MRLLFAIFVLLNKPEVTTMDIALVILAAGMGSRYGGLKQLDQVGPSGQTIMDYSVHDAIEAGFDKIVFVIRRDFSEAFEEQVVSRYRDQVECVTVFQELDAYVGDLDPAVVEARQKPWGTAHAILVAKEAIDRPFAAINADDYYGKEAFGQMAKWLDAHRADEKVYSMMGYDLSNTLSDNGTVNRGICKVDDQNRLIDIFEGLKIGRKADGVVVHQTNGREEELDAHSLVSMNFWGFHPSLMDYLAADFLRFSKETTDDPKSEYFIPFVVNDMMKLGHVVTEVVPTDSRWKGVTYKEDKQAVVEAFAEMSEQGVYPVSF